jgi:predicted permease
MTWRWRLRSLAARRATERDLDDELRSHIEMRAAELRASGMSEAEALLEARRRFGNPAAVREQSRDIHVNRVLETLWQDARYGVRVLAKEPGLALTAILTLALAIGANGAIFSAIQAAVLRPLPFPHPEQLMFVWGRDAIHKRWSLSPADMEDFRKAGSFQAIAALQAQSVNLTGIEEPARVVGAFVSPEYFSILGVQAAMGRTFAPGEDDDGAARTAVLSYALWQGCFGGDPAILGRTLIFNGDPYSVIGVMPRDFSTFLFKGDVWLPSHVYPGYTRSRGQTGVLGIARLAPGVHLAHAQQELNTVIAQLARAYPESNRDRGATLVPLPDLVVQDIKPTLAALAAAVGCLLLIACANIANLLLSKAAGRRQEMSIRAALGAGRTRIVRQLLTESVLLAGAGALLGVGVAVALGRYIAQKASGWPTGLRVELNWPAIAFLAGTTVAAALLFGMAPALMARRSAAEGLRLRRDAGHTRLRAVLAAGQVALAFVLLAGCGLMTESLRRLLHVDTGFDGSHVLTMEYRLPATKYPDAARQARFHAEVVARVQALGGVEAAGIVRGLPFSGNGDSTEIGLPDRPAPPPSAPFIAQYNAATGTYFETVRIPLRAGRTFTAADTLDAPRVAVVSESFVARYWPGKEAVGRQVLIPNRDRDLAPDKPRLVPATVVGVVGNTRHDRLDEPDPPQLYIPYAQDPITFATLAVRTRGNPLDRVRDVERAVWSVDKDQPVWKIRTLESLVDASLGDRRVLLTLFAAFSALALFLAGLGLYGVMAYQVQRRTAEFGLRIAMGASPRDILRMVLREGLALAGAGLVCGLAAAPLFVRVLKAELFGVTAADPMVYAVLSGVLLLASVLAVALPAARATRLDPTAALRVE